MREIKEIVVHCTFTGDEDVTVRDLDRKHRLIGWDGVGYHYVITRTGEVQTGRPVDRAGAHVPGLNKYSIGVAMAGGAPEDNFTQAQYRALGMLVSGLATKYPNARIVGHRDVSRAPTTCPTFDVGAWWKESNPANGRLDVV